MTQQFEQAAPGYGVGAVPPRPALPEQNMGWAVATLIFFWPLAFSAFSHASKVLPLWMVGDFEGARRESDQVKRLGKIALIICAVLTVLLLALYGVMIAAAVASIEATQSTYPTYR